MADHYVDKFLMGLLQYVNVHSVTICFHLSPFLPAGLIEKTIATKSAKIYTDRIAGNWVMSRGAPLGGIYLLKLEGEQVLWKRLITS